MVTTLWNWWCLGLSGQSYYALIGIIVSTMRMYQFGLVMLKLEQHWRVWVSYLFCLLFLCLNFSQFLLLVWLGIILEQTIGIICIEVIVPSQRNFFLIVVIVVWSVLFRVQTLFHAKNSLIETFSIHSHSYVYTRIKNITHCFFIFFINFVY